MPNDNQPDWQKQSLPNHGRRSRVRNWWLQAENKVSTDDTFGRMHMRSPAFASYFITRHKGSFFTFYPQTQIANLKPSQANLFWLKWLKNCRRLGILSWLRKCWVMGAGIPISRSCQLIGNLQLQFTIASTGLKLANKTVFLNKYYTKNLLLVTHKCEVNIRSGEAIIYPISVTPSLDASLRPDASDILILIRI